MKKIIKSIACICLTLAVAIGSCFGAMKLSKNFTFLGTSYNKASAYSFNAPEDSATSTFTTPTFFSSNFPLTSSTDTIPISANPSYDIYSKFYFVFYKNSNTDKISIALILDYVNLSQHIIVNSDRDLYYENIGATISSSSVTYEPVRVGRNSGTANNNIYYSGFYVYRSKYPSISDTSTQSINFKSMIVSNYTNYPYDLPSVVTSNNITNFLSFTFIGDDDYYISIFIGLNGVTTSNSNYVYLDYGQYYFDMTSQYDGNQYYQDGLTEGYNNGFNQGQTEGYNNGFNQGQTEGYNNGYIQGLESSERLGFPALITSVIDIPVKVFTSLFNFDILGVNILTFITSLLTIALILAIVRKVKSD